MVKNAKLDGPFSERDRDRERQREREREREREGILREIVRFAEIFPPEIV